jgi:ribosome biogenesis GTPase
VLLPDGGAVIDTPGLREVGLLAAGEGLEMAFADVELLADRCRFDDCSHLHEPGCAVRAALDSGELALRRYESWVGLRRESERKASRDRARARNHRSRPGRTREDRGAEEA